MMRGNKYILQLFFISSFFVFVSSTTASLEQLFEEQESILLSIRDKVEDLFSNRCSLVKECPCQLDACQSKLTDYTCMREASYEFCACKGSQFDMTKSTIRLCDDIIDENTRPYDEDTRLTVCYSEGLDEEFIKHEEEKDLEWLGFGSSNGLFRIFPGRPQETCGSYDPRIRSWYASAASGAKDIILIIDISKSMNSWSRWTNTLEAVASLLNVITMIDHLNIVVFNDAENTRVLIDEVLLIGTSENKELLLTTLNEILPVMGIPDFKNAFKTAFTLLNESIKQDTTSKCSTSILFITDGVDRTSENSDIVDYIEEEVDFFSKNHNRNVVVFTYTLGEEAAQDIAKEISCVTGGVWNHFKDEDASLTFSTTISTFYSYYSSGMFERNITVWVEPYNFFTGEMLGTSVSTPVFSRESDPPYLLGVVGSGLSIEKMTELDTESNLLQKMIIRSSQCSDFSLTECQIENLRYMASENSVCGISNCNLESVMPERCSEEVDEDVFWCNVKHKDLEMADKACCFCQEEIIAIVVGGTGGFILIVFVIIIIVVAIIGLFLYIKKIKNDKGKGISKILVGTNLKEEDVVTFVEEHMDSEKGIKAKLKFKKSLFEIKSKDIELRNEIGRGGSNTVVYKAFWCEKEVAYKLFKTVYLNERFFVDFEQEVSLLSSISHMNIVQFYGCTLKPPRVGIVMELCSKGSLQELILEQKGRISNQEKFRILNEICDGVLYLHKKSIIHRDLKPDNCLFNRNMDVKIIDFGLSKIVKSYSSHNLTSQIGTPGFMAPEMVSANNYNEKVDVYSFAMIIYQILLECNNPYELTVQNPKDMAGIDLKACNNPNFRPKIKYGNIKRVGEVEVLIEICKTCWNVDPKVRLSFEEIKKIISRPEENSKEKLTELVKKRKSSVLEKVEILSL